MQACAHRGWLWGPGAIGSARRPGRRNRAEELRAGWAGGKLACCHRRGCPSSRLCTGHTCDKAWRLDQFRTTDIDATLQAVLLEQMHTMGLRCKQSLCVSRVYLDRTPLVPHGRLALGGVASSTRMETPAPTRPQLSVLCLFLAGGVDISTPVRAISQLSSVCTNLHVAHAWRRVRRTRWSTSDAYAPRRAVRGRLRERLWHQGAYDALRGRLSKVDTRRPARTR